MDSNYQRQSQFELFPGAVRKPVEASSSRFFLRSLTLSLENLVVVSIIMMVGLILSFSLGVERGRHALRAEMAAADRKMTEKLENSAVAGPDAGQPVVTQTGGAALDKPMVGQPLRSVGTPVAVNNNNLAQFNNAAPGAKKAALVNLPSGIQPPAEKNIDKVQNKSYTIQVASFKKDEFAQKEAVILKKKGFDAIVIPKGSYSIVCVGTFAKKEEAKAFSRKLKGQYRDTVIRSL